MCYNNIFSTESDESTSALNADVPSRAQTLKCIIVANSQV